MPETSTLHTEPYHTLLEGRYEKIKEHSITNRRISYNHYHQLIHNLSTEKLFSIQKLGESVQNRDIYSIKIGTGKRHILLWSQMHGHESTATMALMDIFNYFRAYIPNDNILKDVLKKITIHFIPMLNPDGAQNYKRTNAIDIDINRDARKRTSPEAQILYNYCQKIKPVFGFNLHDQHKYFYVESTGKPATISLMAPDIDNKGSIDYTRKRAMQLIVNLLPWLQGHIPGHIARYEDGYEPRSFGDLFQSNGVSTILFESGGYSNDSERQFARKLSFMLLMQSFVDIAFGSFVNKEIQQYFDLPPGKESMFEFIVNNATIKDPEQKFTFDIGIRNQEIQDTVLENWYAEGVINEIGDLSGAKSYNYFDAVKLIAEPGKILPKHIDTIEQLLTIDVKKLYKLGYTSIKTSFQPDFKLIASFPFQLLPYKQYYKNSIELHKLANFTLRDEKGVRYICIKGRLICIDD